MQSDIKGRECESRLQSKSEREKDVINGAESKRLNEKMCSPADADTYRNSLLIITEQRKGSEHAEQSADSLPVFFIYGVFAWVIL